MSIIPFKAPGAYAPEKSASVLLDNSPKYTFGMRTQAEKPVDTPGRRLSSNSKTKKIKIKNVLMSTKINFFFKAPGDYAPEKSTGALLDNSPKYTFGMRTHIEKPVETPGRCLIQDNKRVVPKVMHM